MTFDTPIDSFEPPVTEDSMIHDSGAPVNRPIESPVHPAARCQDKRPRRSPAAEEPGEVVPVDDPRVDEAMARNVRDMASGLYFYAGTARIFPQLKTSTCVEYVNGVVEDCGNPRDPLERYLIEQCIQMHHAAGRLLAKAEGAGSAEASSLLIAAAARMFSEYRKSFIALRSVRQAPAAPTKVTVIGNVGQQNLAGGTQQYSIVQHASEASASGPWEPE